MTCLSLHVPAHERHVCVYVCDEDAPAESASIRVKCLFLFTNLKLRAAQKYKCVCVSVYYASMNFVLK